jgi:hypothetical protein
MRLLNGMKPFASFDLDGRSKKKLEDQKPALPQWLTKIPDKDLRAAADYCHYAQPSTTAPPFSARLPSALPSSPACTARDWSMATFHQQRFSLAKTGTTDVWLMDADNMRLELPSGGVSVYTPELRCTGGGAGP